MHKNNTNNDILIVIQWEGRFTRGRSVHAASADDGGDGRRERGGRGRRGQRQHQRQLEHQHAGRALLARRAAGAARRRRAAAPHHRVTQHRCDRARTHSLSLTEGQVWLHFTSIR